MDPKIASPLNQYLVHTNAWEEVHNKTWEKCKDTKGNNLHHEHSEMGKVWGLNLENDYTKYRQVANR